VTVVAIADYPAESPAELSFRIGDVLSVIKQDVGGWWVAELNGKRGSIPNHFVREQETVTPPSSRNDEMEFLQEQLQIMSSLVTEKDARIQALEAKQAPVPASLLFPEEDVIGATNSFDSSLKIGEGSCGEVFKARLGGKPVAIKRLLPLATNRPENLQAEVEVLSKFRHPHLVTLLGHTDLAGPRPCLIFELLPQGNLRDRLDCLEATPPLAWDIRIRIAWETACGLAFLHQPHSKANVVVHLDVKSDNILLSNQFEAKLSDFGLVRSLGRTAVAQASDSAGTLGYLCPEYVVKRAISAKTDVYAFGVVLAELLTGKKATITQRSGRPLNLAQLIREKMPTPASIFASEQDLDPTVRETWPADSYRTFAQIMRQCLEPTSATRPTMAEVCERLKALVDGNHKVCVVCFENPTNARLQCGHAALCAPCSDYIRRRGDGCPICRAPIVSVQQGMYSRTYIP